MLYRIENKLIRLSLVMSAELYIRDDELDGLGGKLEITLRYHGGVKRVGVIGDYLELEEHLDHMHRLVSE